MGYRNKNTFTIELTSEDGTAKLTFRKPLTNTILDLISQLPEDNAARLKKDLTHNMQYLVSIEGLENEDGSEVTVEQVKNLEIDFHLARAINAGFLAQIFNAETDQEKKEKTSA